MVPYSTFIDHKTRVATVIIYFNKVISTENTKSINGTKHGN